MNKTKLLVVSAGAAFLLCAGTASARDCDPKPVTGTLESMINTRDTVGMSTHLADMAGLSPEFVKAHGEDGVHGAIDSLVRKFFESRTAADDVSTAEAAALAERFREGIIEACDTIREGQSDEKAKKQAIRAANLSGGDSDFALLLGTANSLEGDGNFSAGLEASFQSTTDFVATTLPGIGRFYAPNSERVITGTFEITFSEIGSIDEDVDDTGGASPPADSPRNPFEAGGGFFRLNTSADFYFAPKGASGLGVRVGGGFSTQPSDNSDDDVDTRSRVYGGVVFRANYGADDRGREGKGEVFLGYAKDKFWKYDRIIDDSVMPALTERVNESGRLVVDARMDIPQVFESEDVRLHARLFADLPASGKGPSDIRVSLLLTVNLGAFFPVD